MEPRKEVSGGTFWAQLTQWDPVTNRFAWKEVVRTKNDFQTLPGGRVGSLAVNPAYDPDNVAPAIAASDDRAYFALQRSYFDPVLDWVYLIVATSSPQWQYFHVTQCPSLTDGLYTGNIVTWDGKTEEILILNARGVAANQPLAI